MPKLKELSEFVEADDRDDTPIFGGREREIEVIGKDLRRRMRNWRERGKATAWKSATRVIQGAPGAGKTALLEHLAETLPGEVEGLQVCWLDSEKLGNDNHAYGGLARALNPALWKKAKAEVAVTWGGGFSVKLAKGEGRRTTRTQAGDPWEEFVALTEDAGAKKPEAHTKKPDGTVKVPPRPAPPREARPVLLLIDEIQNAPGERGEPASAFLSSIHKSTAELPIFPVYGGLAWSEERLDELGISRLSDRATGPSNVQTLAPLPENEIRAVCARFFEHFEIEGSGRLRERWAEEVVAESLGWPHHVHTHLQSLGGALLAPGVAGDLDALECAGAEAEAKVGKNAAKLRERYYGRRLALPALQEQGRLAAAAALRIAPGTDTVARLGREIERMAESRGASDPDMELPEGMNGKDFANAMIRAGILHKSMGGGMWRISVPIPSFLDYLKRKLGAGEIPEAKTQGEPGAPGG